MSLGAAGDHSSVAFRVQGDPAAALKKKKDDSADPCLESESETGEKRSKTRQQD